MENKCLSIAIPTYNRKDALLRLLKGIEALDCSPLYEIIISDNCSNYDIESALKENLSPDFLSICRLVKNKVTIGSSGNIRNQYLLCQTKWLWLIGDDDEVEPDCLKYILNDIISDPDCALFRYSISYDVHGRYGKNVEDDITMNSIQDFINYYHYGTKSKGNMVFMSNNVFNMEKLAPYVYYSFMFSTPINPLIPAFKGLDEHKIYIRYRSAVVCKYNEPETNNHWDRIRVLLSLSTVSHIPFKSLNETGLNKLMQTLNFISFKAFCGWVIKNKSIPWGRIQMVYHDFYQFQKSVYKPILYILLKLEMKYRFSILTFIKKIKG